MSLYFEIVPIDIVYNVMVKLKLDDLYNFMDSIPEMIKDINWKYFIYLMYGVRFKHIKDPKGMILSLYLRKNVECFKSKTPKSILNTEYVLDIYDKYSFLLPKLKEIDCMGVSNELRLPDVISSTKITRFIIIVGTLTLSDGFYNLKSLNHLYIYAHKLSGLDSRLGQLTALRYLNIDIWRTELNLGISNLVQLHTLNLRYLPSDVNTLVQLKNLSINTSVLISLPSMSRLTSLCSLRLITPIVVDGDLLSVSTLTNLKHLDIDCIPPEDFRGLVNLKFLKIMTGDSLPMFISGLTKLSTLQTRSMSKRVHIPDYIIQLKNLHYIGISYDESLRDDIKACYIQYGTGLKRKVGL